MKMEVGGGDDSRRAQATGVTGSLAAATREPSRPRSCVELIVILWITVNACAASRAHYREPTGREAERSAEQHLKRADAFERAGNLQHAYEEYRAAFAADPFDDYALLKRDLVREKILARAVESKQVLPVSGQVATGAVSAAATHDSMQQSPIPKVTILLDPMDLVAPVGEEMSVDVVASRDLRAATFDVTFDPNLVSIVRAQFCPGAGGNCQALAREGALSVSLNGAMLSSDGLVCAIVLKAGAPGSSVLRVINGRASDRDGKPLGVEPLSASVQILRLEDIPI